MGKDNRNPNAGLSLFEMVAVLAIISIMIGIMTISISTVNRNEVFRTEEKLESLINKARVAALTKGTKNGSLYIARSSGTYYSYVGDASEFEGGASADNIKKFGDKLCGSRVNIIYGTDIIDNGNVISINFKQSTGGLNGGAGKILVQDNRNKIKSATIQIYSETGKIYH